MCELRGKGEVPKGYIQSDLKTRRTLLQVSMASCEDTDIYIKLIEIQRYT